MSEDIESIDDNELLSMLELRYAPSVIPPCRVCGKPLGIGRIGGGEPTIWVCPDTKLTNGGMDWTHYENSEYVDRMRGGDEDVIELIRRYRSLSPNNQ